MQEELCDSFVIVRVMRVAAAATLLQTKLRAAPEDRQTHSFLVASFGSGAGGVV